MKMFWFMVWHIEHWLVERCHHCHSMKVDKLEGTEEKNIYKAKYKCFKCGAIAKVEEI